MVRRGRLPVGAALIASSVLGAVELCAVGTVVACVASGLPLRTLLDTFVPTNCWLGATFAPFGALVAARRPRNPIGWLFLGFSGCYAVSAFSFSIAAFGVARHPAAIWVDPVGWLALWAWTPGVSLFLPLILLLFPSGHLPSPRWRPVAWVAALLGVLWPLGWALDPGSASGTVLPGRTLHPPPAIARVGTDLVNGLNVALGPILVLSLVSLIVRVRRARGPERLQVTWFLWGVAVACLLLIPRFVSDSAGIALLFGVPIIPATAAVAVLRYRLYDIDRIVSRTVSYTALTGLLIAMYATLVTATSILLPAGSSLGVAASTLFVATLFHPLRRRIQQSVDRRFNRSHYDAARMVEAFNVRLREQVDLDELRSDLLTVVRQTVQPSSINLWLRNTGVGPTASVGGPPEG